jgi:hypothetical protein
MYSFTELAHNFKDTLTTKLANYSQENISALYKTDFLIQTHKIILQSSETILDVII